MSERKQVNEADLGWYAERDQPITDAIKQDLDVMRAAMQDIGGDVRSVEAPAPAQPIQWVSNKEDMQALVDRALSQPAQPVASPEPTKSMTITEFLDYLGSPECDKELKQKIVEMGRVEAAVASPRAEEIARQIVADVSEHAIKLAIVRNSLVAGDDEELDEDEIVSDAVACLVGDDTGCLDPDDPQATATLDNITKAMRDYASSLEARLKNSEKWLGYIVLAVCDPVKIALGRENLTLGKAVEIAIDRLNALGAAEARADKAEAGNRGLAQQLEHAKRDLQKAEAERDELRQLHERIHNDYLGRDAGECLADNAAAKVLQAEREYTATLAASLRDVQETLRDHEWFDDCDNPYCPACGERHEHKPSCWLSALLTRLSTKSEKP